MSHSSLGPPIAGAYMPITVSLSLADSETRQHRVRLPEGMSAILFGVSVSADTVNLVGGAPTVEVGTAADPNGYLEAVALADDASSYKGTDEATVGALVDSASGRAVIAAEGEILITVTSIGANSSATDAAVTLWLYCSSHANNTPGRIATRNPFRDPKNGQ